MARYIQVPTKSQNEQTINNKHDQNVFLSLSCNYMTETSVVETKVVLTV